MANFLIPELFGRVKIERCNNVRKLEGSNNEGCIIGNSNVNLFASACTLNLNRNSELEVNVETSDLELTNCANVKIEGTGHKLKLHHDSNSVIRGHRNNISASHNANWSIDGSDNKIVKLANNNNLIFSINKGNITAENSSDVTLLGENPNVQIKHIANHKLLPSETTGENKVVIDANCNINVEYNQEAMIDRDRYKIGLFPITLKKQSPQMFELSVDESVRMVGNVQKIEDKSQVTFSTQEGDQKETLIFVAPTIKPHGNKFIINSNLFPRI